MPSNFLFIADENNDRPPHAIKRIFVHRCSHPQTGKSWSYITETDYPIAKDGALNPAPCLWVLGTTSRDFAQNGWHEFTSPHREGRPLLPISDVDKRTSVCIQRLILNICLAFQTPANVRPVNSAAKRSEGPPSRNRVPGQLPDFRLFRLGTEVSHDLRERVQDFISGRTKRKLGTQFVVAGHWTHQAHGPRKSLRRLQWIQPYWKGPLDAPVLIRSHSVPTKADDEAPEGP
jgi:hypothetical protein